jgi:required for meiotic nuclear division protein 1
MSASLLSPNPSRKLPCRAWFLGSRIEMRRRGGNDLPDVPQAVERLPLGGTIVLFRFGAIVTFDVDDAETQRYVESIAPRIFGRFELAETEHLDIEIDAERGDLVDESGRIVLRDRDERRLQVVANALAKSVVLAHHEGRLAPVIERVERFAEQLRAGHGSVAHADLLREIGDVLLVQSRMLGRAEVTEKPELTWDAPELDRFYERLSSELELRDRDLALSRKLDLVARTSELYLNLLHNRQGLRLEWYIVLLILVEIALIVYEIFFLE